MLKRRLIPKLQLRRSKFGGRPVLVTTVRFSQTIEVGDPVSQARIYQAQAADELIFLDLDSQANDAAVVTAVVQAAAEEIFMPFTVGGGVRSVDDFRTLLSHGADKVSVNTAAFERPELITEAADAYGAQCVVLSIDARRRPDGYRVVTNCGTAVHEMDPVEWAVEGQRRGAGEILLTSIDRDGTRTGIDVELTRRVVDSVDVPVIASGGCGKASDFGDAFIDGGADAVAAGTYFSFQDQNPMQTRSQIRNRGVPIRMHT